MSTIADRIEENRLKLIHDYCLAAIKDCEVVTVSTDSEFTHLAWSTTPRKQGGLGEMRIAMLSDKSHRISKAYGVFDEDEGISYRALFVVDNKKKLRHVTINDIGIPRSVDEVLRVVEACQFVDKYGNVCPMGPKEKIENAESDSEKCKDFFSTE